MSSALSCLLTAALGPEAGASSMLVNPMDAGSEALAPPALHKDQQQQQQQQAFSRAEMSAINTLSAVGHIQRSITSFGKARKRKLDAKDLNY